MNEQVSAIANLLEASAEIVREVGLHKGKYWEGAFKNPDGKYPGGSVCTLGALCVATQRLELTEGHSVAAGVLVRDQIRMGDNGPWSNEALIPLWNDHADRTAEDVVETFLQAAKTVRNGE